MKTKKKKIMTRFDLWREGYRVYVDGVEQSLFESYPRSSSGRIECIDGKEVNIYHHAPKHHSRSKFITPSLNTKVHPYGEIKTIQYYHMGLMAYHRFLYIWFYDDLLENNDVCHIDGNSLNNNISNLKQDSRKNNLAARKGNINQYGKRLKDDDKYFDLKYQLDVCRNLKNEHPEDEYAKYLWHVAVKELKEYKEELKNESGKNK